MPRYRSNPLKIRMILGIIITNFELFFKRKAVFGSYIIIVSNVVLQKKKKEEVIVGKVF